MRFFSLLLSLTRSCDGCMCMVDRGGGAIAYFCSFRALRARRHVWMTPSDLPAVIQKTISPMLSRRTTFHTFLKEIGHRHGQLDRALPADSPAKSCLAIRHPAFAVEIKVSGEV